MKNLLLITITFFVVNTASAFELFRCEDKSKKTSILIDFERNKGTISTTVEMSGVSGLEKHAEDRKTTSPITGTINTEIINAAVNIYWSFGTPDQYSAELDRSKDWSDPELKVILKKSGEMIILKCDGLP